MKQQQYAVTTCSILGVPLLLCLMITNISPNMFYLTQLQPDTTSGESFWVTCTETKTTNSTLQFFTAQLIMNRLWPSMYHSPTAIAAGDIICLWPPVLKGTRNLENQERLGNNVRIYQVQCSSVMVVNFLQKNTHDRHTTPTPNPTPTHNPQNHAITWSNADL